MRERHASGNPRLCLFPAGGGGQHEGEQKDCEAKKAGAREAGEYKSHLRSEI